MKNQAVSPTAKMARKMAPSRLQLARRRAKLCLVAGAHLAGLRDGFATASKGKAQAVCFSAVMMELPSTGMDVDGMWNEVTGKGDQFESIVGG